jgi:hypothetical protein
MLNDIMESDGLGREERAQALELEKLLAHHHRALSSLLGQFEHYGDSECADPLRSALWALGVCILRVVKT